MQESAILVGAGILGTIFIVFIFWGLYKCCKRSNSNEKYLDDQEMSEPVESKPFASDHSAPMDEKMSEFMQNRRSRRGRYSTDGNDRIMLNMLVQ